jgi:exonuclease I
MKARSHPELLDAAEQSQWQEFVASKLYGEGDWLNLEKFYTRLDELTLSLNEQGDVSKLALLQLLRDHGSALSQQYPKAATD